MRQLILPAFTALAVGIAIGATEPPATAPSTTSAPTSSSQPATTSTSAPASSSQPTSIPGPPAPAATEFPRYQQGVTDDQIVAAIKKGADYLLALRRNDNFEVYNNAWTRGPTERGGETALIVYALLAASDSIDDPDFRKKTNFASTDLAPVVTYLKNLQPDGTYVAALQACALTSLPRTPDIVAALERPKGPKDYLFHATNESGGYEYSVPGAVIDAHITDLEKDLADLRAKQSAPGKKTPDDMKNLADDIKNKLADIAKARTDLAKEKTAVRNHWNADGSNTQYGVLGAWAMAEWGINMPAGFWTQQDNFWRRSQLPDGGFPYSKNAKPPDERETMAPAGLASLYLTQEFLDVDAKLDPRIDKNMQAAVKHISENFNPNPNDQYYGYGIERAGVASGLKFFGSHEWYPELAADLVKSQNADGSWLPHFYAGPGNSQTIPTCYALLILARGRNPVMINKLDYGDAGGHWNNRSRDVARLTAKMAKNFERPLNWQIVTHLSKPEDWMDAPILFLAGSEDPKFSDDDIEKLRAYVEMGGIIFSSADGDSPAFTEAVRKAAAQVIPGREMRELPPTHPLFNGELWTKIDAVPKILALSNGIREVWIHSTVDMAATWQRRDNDPKAYWDFPGNVYFYATGKVNLKNRLQSLVVDLPPIPDNAPPRPRLYAARLLVGDNPDPEPGAWPRMARLMQACCNTDMEVHILTIHELAQANPPAVVLTGTTPFTVSPADMKALKTYLDNGGTMLADAAAMSEPFAASFAKLCHQLYPINPLEPLAKDSPIYAGTEPNAHPILAVRYRQSYMNKFGILTQPHLEGVRLGIRGATPGAWRYVILYSPEDLTSGLLGTNTWGILGYTPESARALARNMLLYTLHHAPPATTQPTSQPSTQTATTQSTTHPATHPK